VRCLQRIGRRGLSTACIEGMLASSAPMVAVIDADHQHDEQLLPKMFALIQRWRTRRRRRQPLRGERRHRHLGFNPARHVQPHCDHAAQPRGAQGRPAGPDERLSS
jgi:glycosyltransferase involved in cell wall biosynthesis